MNLIFDQVELASGSSINAGTGTVSIRPNATGQVINLLGSASSDSAGTMDLNAAEFGRITAGTLSIGSGTNTGGISIIGSADLSATGPSNFVLNTGGNYVGTGQTITLGTKTYTVTAGGFLNSGSLTGGATTIALNSAGTMNINGNVSVTGTGRVNLASTTNAGNITLGGVVGGGSITSISAFGTSNMVSGGGTVTATSMTLVTGTGNIGASGARISLSGTSLSVAASTLSSTVFLQGVSDLTFGTVDANIFNYRSGNNVTVAGKVDPTLIDVSVAGSITDAGGSFVANTISLTSGTGNIGASGANRITIDGDIVSANASSGNVYIEDKATDFTATGTSLTTSGANTSSGTFEYITTNNGALTLAGNVIGATINLSTHGTGNMISGAGTVSGTMVSLSSGTGSIGASGSRINTAATSLTIASGAAAFINQNGASTLTGATVTGALNVASNNDVVVSGNATGGTILLSTSGVGSQLTVNNGVSLSTAGNIILTGDRLTLAGATGNRLVGSSIFIASNAASKNISIGTGATDSASLLAVDDVELARISASTLTIGDTVNTSHLGILSDLNIGSGGLNYTLNLSAGGNITGAERATTLGTNSLNLAAVGMVSIANTSASKAFNATSISAGSVTLSTTGTGSGLSIGSIAATSGNVILQTTNTTSNITVGGNLSSGGSLTVAAVQSSFSLNSITSGSTTSPLLLMAGYDSNGTLSNAGATGSIGGSLSIAQGSGKDVSIFIADGNIFTNSYWNQNLSFNNLFAKTNGNASSFSFGGNLTTASILSLGTAGTNANITVVGNVSVGGVNALFNAVQGSTISIGGNFDNSNSAGNVQLYAGATGSSVTLGGTLNIADGAGKSFDLNAASDNVYAKTYFDTARSFFNFYYATNQPISIRSSLTGSGIVSLFTSSNNILANPSAILSGYNEAHFIIAGASGNVGAVGSPVSLDVNNVSISIPGNAYLYQDATSSFRTITLAGGGTSVGGSLSLTATHNIALFSNVVAGEVTFISSGVNRNIFLNSGTTLNTSFLNGNILLQADQVGIAGTISAGTGTVSIRPNATSQVINLLGNATSDSAGTFDLSQQEFGRITAGTLSIGSGTNTGGISIIGSADLSASGPSNFVLNTGGNYVGTGQTITLGTKTYTVTAGGFLNSGSLTGGATTIALNSAGTMNINGNVSVTGAGRVNLASTTNAGNITLGGNVGGGAITSISGFGTSNIVSGAGTVSGTSVTLASGTGNIGASGSRINTAATSLSITSGAQAFINQNGTLTLTGASVTNALDIASNNDVVVSGNATGGTINLATSGVGSQLTVNNGVSLSTAGNITLTGDRLTLAGASGNRLVGTLISISPNATSQVILIGGSGTDAAGTLAIDGTELGRISGGTVNIGNTANTANSSLIGDIDLTSLYTLNVNSGGLITATDRAFTLGTNQLNLSTTGNVSVTQSTSGKHLNLTSVTGANVSLQALTASTNVSLGGSVSSSGNLDVQALGNVSIVGNVNNAGGAGTSAILNAGFSNVTLGTGGTGGTSFNVGGTISIASNSSKNIYVTTGTGNLLDNAFFTNSLNANNVTYATQDNAKNILLGNITSAGTLRLLTYGVNSAIQQSAGSLWTAGTVVLQQTNGVDIGSSGSRVALSSGQISILGQSVTSNIFLTNAVAATLSSSVSMGGAINVTNTGVLTLGSISMGTGTLSVATDSGSAISVGSQAVSAGTISLSAGGAGNIVQASTNTLTGTSINLSSGTGDIGAGSAVRLAASTLTASSGGSSNVSITNAGAVTINSASAGANLSIGGTSNSDLSLNGNISAGTSVGLFTSGTGSIVQSNSGTSIAAGTISLSAAGGNIGATGAGRIRTNGTQLSISNSGTGNAFVHQLSSGTITGVGLSTGTFDLTTATGSNANLVQDNHITAGRINLSLDGTGSLTRGAGGALRAGTISIALGTGNIGASGNAIQIESTPSLWISGSTLSTQTWLQAYSDVRFETIDTNIFNFRSGYNVTVAGKVDPTLIDVSVAGNITDAGGSFVANTISLTSGTGNIGGSGVNRITIDGDIVSANASSGNVYLEDKSTDFTATGTSLTTSAANASTGILEYVTTNNGALTLAGNVTGATINLSTHGGGNIVSGAGSVSGTSATLSSGFGNIGAGGSSRIQLSVSTLTSSSTGGGIYLNMLNSGTLNSISTGSGGFVDILASTNINLSLNGNMSTSLATISLNGSGSLVQTGTSSITASTLYLYGGTGHIGASGVGRINTAVNTLIASSGTGGNIWINQTGALNITGNSVFLVRGDYNIASNSSIRLQDNTSIAGNLNWSTTGGPINMDNGSGLSISAQNITLSATATVGNGITIGNAATTLTARGAGAASTLNFDDDAGTVGIPTLAAGTAVFAGSAGTISINGDLSNAGTLEAIATSGTININYTTSLLDLTNTTLNAGGSSGPAITLTNDMSGAGNNGTTLDGGVSNTGGVINLTTSATATASGTGTTLTAATLNLLTSGSGGVSITGVTSNNLSVLGTHSGGLLSISNTASSNTLNIGALSVNSGGSHRIAGAGILNMNGLVSSSAANTLNLFSGSILNLANTVSLASGGRVNLTADQIRMQSGTISVGTGVVSIAPNTISQTIAFGSSTADNDTASLLDVSNTELGNITAGTVIIGGSGLTSSISLVGNVDFSSRYNVSIQTGGLYTGQSNTISMGTNQLSISAGGLLTSGVLNATTGSLNLTGGTLTVNGVISGGNNSIALNSTSNGNINIGQNISNTGNISILANGSGTIGQSAGTFSATRLLVTSGTGAIVAGGTVQTAAQTLSLSTGSTSSVTFNNTGALTLLNTSIVGAALTVINNTDITLSGTNTANGMRLSLTGPNSMLRIASGGTLSSTANVTLTADQVSINTTGGSIAAGTNTVILNPTTSTQVLNLLGASTSDSAGTLDLNAGEMGRITAGTLSIGSTLNTGGISIIGSADLSATGPSNFVLNTGESYTGSGQSISIGSKNWLVSTAGTLTTGSLNATTGSISLTSGDTLSVAGALTASGASQVSLSTTSNDAINLGANISTGGNIAIAANGTGTIGQSAGTLSAVSLRLTSGTGAIVSGGTLQTAAQTLSLSTGSTSNVAFNNTGAMTLSASSIGGLLTGINNTHMTLNGTNTANGMNLSLTGANSTLGIASAATLSSTANVTLTADQVSINTTSGSIAAGSNNVLIRPRTSTQAFDLFGANADSAGTLAITAAELGRIAANTVSIGSAAHSGNVVLGTGDLSSAAISLIDVRSTGTYMGGNTTLGTQTYVASVAGSMTAGTLTAGNNQIALTGAGISLNGNVSNTGTMTLSSTGSGNISGAGTLSATSLTLTAASGSIGASGSRINTAASSISITSGAAAFINQSGVGTLTGATVTNALDIASNNDVVVSGDGTGGTINVSTNGVGSQLTVNSGVSLSTAGNMTLISDRLTLAGTSGNRLSATSLSIAPNGNQTILIGGTATDGASTLAIDGTELARISTSTLTIGDMTKSGGMSLLGNYTSPSILNLFNAGLFNAGGFTLSMGSNALNISVLGTLTSGSIAGTTGNVTLTSDDVLSVAGAITGGNNQITLSTTSNDAINLAANILNSGNISILANGSGTIGQTSGTLSSGSLRITSGTGSIVSGGTLQTAVQTLSLSTGSTSAAAFNNTGAMTLSASSIGGALTGVNNTHLTLSGTNTANGMNFSLTGANSTFAIASAATLSSSANVTLSADQFSINTTSGSIAMGANTLFLRPTTATQAINLFGASSNDSAGTLDLNAAETGRITAGTLSIGTSGQANDVTIIGSADLSGLGVAAYRITTAGNYTGTGQSLTLGTRTYNISTGGTLATGAVSAGAIALDWASTGNTTVTGNVSASTINLSTAGTSDILWTAGTLTGANTISLSTGGNIGASGARLRVAGGTLRAMGNLASSQMFFQGESGLTLGTSDSNTFNYITQAATGFGVAIQGKVDPELVVISVDGAITDAGGSIVGNTIQLTSNTSNIGASGARIRVDSNILSAVAGSGNVYLNELGSTSLTLGTANAAGGTFDLITNTASNGSVTLGGNVTAGSRVNIALDGNGNLVYGSGSIAATSISLSTGLGNLGASGNSLQTAATSLTLSIASTGSAFVNNTGAVSLAASAVAGGLSLSGNNNIVVIGNTTAGSINLSTSGTGSQVVVNNAVSLSTAGNATFTADQIRLLGTGNRVTASTLTLLANASPKTISVGGSVDDADSGSLLDISNAELGKIAASMVNIGSTGNSGNLILGGDLDLTSLYILNLSAGGNITGADRATTLGSNQLNLTALGNVSVTNTSTNKAFNATSISAANVTLSTSGTNSGLSIGSIAATTGNIILQTSNTGSNITVGGNLSSSGSLTVAAIQSSFSLNNVTAGSATTPLVLLAGYNAGGTLSNAGATGSIAGGLSIAQGSGKDVTILIAGGNAMTNAYWNQNITLGNVSLFSNAASSGVSIGGNLTANNLIVSTAGSGSDMTIAGNLSTTGSTNIRLNAGDLVVTGNIADTGATLARLSVGSGNSISMGGTVLNIAGASGKTLDIHTGTSNDLYNQGFFTTGSNVTFGSIHLTTAAAGGISLGRSFTSTNNFSISTTGASAPIETGAGVTLTATSLNLSATGNIGSSVQSLNTAANTLVINSSTGAAWINQSGASTLLGSSANWLFQLITDNNLAITQAVSGSSITITSTATNGDLSLATTGSLSTTGNGPIHLIADRIRIAPTGSGIFVNAGSGTVTIQTQTAKTFAVGGTTDDADSLTVLDISAPELDRIQAGLLQLGSAGINNTISLAGNIDVAGTGAGNFNLNITTGGNYSGNTNTLSLGTNTLTISTAGALTSGVISGGATTISLTSGNTMSINGNVTVTGSGVIEAQTTSNDNIVVNATLGGGLNTNVMANGTGNISGSGTVTGTSISLSTGSGLIGASAGTPLLVDATSLTVQAGTGSAYIQDINTVSVMGSSAGNTLSIGATGNLTVAQSIAANLITLATTASNGNISLADTVNATTSLSINTNGSGSITGGSSGNPLALASTLRLGSTSGNISLYSDAQRLGFNTTGNVSLFNTGSTGTTQIDTASTANNLSLSFDSTSLVNTASVTTTGNMLLTGTQNAHVVSLNNSLNASGTLTFDLNNTSGLGVRQITQAGGTLFADQLNFIGANSIGTTLNPVDIQVTRLSIDGNVTGGNAHLLNTATSGTMSLVGATLASRLNLTANNNMLISGAVDAPTLTLSTTGSNNLIVGANISASSQGSLLAGGNLLNTTGAFRTLSAGSIRISTGGQLNAPSLNLSSASGLSITVGDFTQFGLHNLTGTTLTGSLVSGGNFVVNATNGPISLGSVDAIALGLGNISLSALGGTGSIALATGSTLNAQNIRLTAANGIIGTGISLNATTGNIIGTTSAQSLTLQGNVTANAGTLSLAATNGRIDVDTAGAASSYSAQSITLNANAAQSVRILNSGTTLTAIGGGGTTTYTDGMITTGMTINAASAAGGRISTNGDLQNAGTLSALGGNSNISINYSAGNLDLTNVTITTAGTLQQGVIARTNDIAGGDGTLIEQSGIGAGQITVVTNNGYSILGTGLDFEGTGLAWNSANQLSVSGNFRQTTMTGGAANSLIVTDTTATNLNITSLSAGTTASIQATAGQINLGRVTATGNVTLTGNTGIFNASAAANNVSTAGTLVISTTNGDIGAASQYFEVNLGGLQVSTNPGYHAYIRQAGNLNLGNTSVGGTLNLQTTSNGNISINGASLFANTLNLAANGSGTINSNVATSISVTNTTQLTSGTGQISVTGDMGTVTASTNNTIWLTDNNGLTVGAGGVTGTSLTLSTAANMMVGGSLSGSFISILAGGALLQSNTFTGNALTAPDGARIQAQYIGELSSPVKVSIGSPGLSILVTGKSADGLSGVMTGSSSPLGRPSFERFLTSKFLWNGIDLFITVFGGNIARQGLYFLGSDEYSQFYDNLIENRILLTNRLMAKSVRLSPWHVTEYASATEDGQPTVIISTDKPWEDGFFSFLTDEEKQKQSLLKKKPKQDAQITLPKNITYKMQDP